MDSFQKFDRFRKHVSPFGQEVLNVMIRQWNKDREETRRRQQRILLPIPRRENRILNFNPETEVPLHVINPCVAPPPTHTDLFLDKEHCEQDDDEAPFDFTNLMDARSHPHVATSTQQIKPHTEISSKPKQLPQQQQLELSRDDLINNPTYPRPLFRDEPNALQIESPKNESKSENIDWDDMFDTCLFPDIPVTDKNIKTNRAIKKNDSKLLEKQTTAEQSKNPIQILSNILITKDMSKKKAIKRKIDSSTNKNKVQSKRTNVTSLLQQEVPETAYRKENYNTSVKKWLSNVGPNNAVNEELSNDEKFAAEASDYKPIITVDKASKRKDSKKVVQSKLANKDGVMKFKKPKEFDKENEVPVEKTVEATTKENTTTAKTTKVKPKFVAPIKSQIPVKDVTYDIVSVNETNLNCLFEIGANSIQMILLYSNGFCQLNRQHTDDDCEPEGIMLHVDDDFYYISKQVASQNMLKDVFTDILTNKDVICYEGKHLLIYLAKQYDIDLFMNEFRMLDVKIGVSLIDPDNPPEDFSKLQKAVSFTAPFSVATECPRQKAAWYCSSLAGAARALRAALLQEELWKLYIDIEVPLVPLIADMEYRGVCVDEIALKSMDNMLLEKMKIVEQQCYKAAGKTFQINSTLQVRGIIYDELKLDSKCNVKIRETIITGAKSTSETMLKSLSSEHPLPGLILEYRRLHKAHATFVTGIAQHVKNGVVRPSWEQSAAATGRIASNNPNLQAIPKEPFSLEMSPEPGSAATAPLEFRSVYKARAGGALLAADFRHVECRVFAHAAADGALRRALAAHDLFIELAASWLNKEASQVTPADRERTKRVVYASLYGAGARRLADLLGLEPGEAQNVIDSFHKSFPMLRSFGRAAAARCMSAGGRLVTGAGRARRLPHIASADPARRAQAERQAVNFLVQGSAADVCKAAMAMAARALRALPRPYPSHTSGPASAVSLPPARLLLQIHDELVWEVRAELVAEAAG